MPSLPRGGGVRRGWPFLQQAGTMWFTKRFATDKCFTVSSLSTSEGWTRLASWQEAPRTSFAVYHFWKVRSCCLIRACVSGSIIPAHDSAFYLPNRIKGRLPRTQLLPPSTTLTLTSLHSCTHLLYTYHRTTTTQNSTTNIRNHADLRQDS
jgi:hypothetical protein